MGQQEEPRDDEETVAKLVCAAVAVLVVAGFVWLMVHIARLPPSTHPDYMVSITGVDGLNLEATSGGVPTPLSPVFNLTVRIVNPGNVNPWDSACVWGLSTAVVSYGDAFLGRGSVPPFCAEENEVRERMATAWGEDVVLPRFLRERLSGEMERGDASLDVQVTMPAGCSQCTDKVLVCNKVKIGGSSPSPCRVEEVYPRPQPAPAAAGSTG
jgi:hypothetical protein